MGLPPIIEGLRRKPDMFLLSTTFDCVVAFLDGYDAAQSGGLLAGFREWLIVRADDGNNLAWPGLVSLLLKDKLTSADNDRRIKYLFDLLDEFIAVRNENDGLRRIYIKYESWLRRQAWYTSRSPSWVPIEGTQKRRSPKG
jgi:hypothetical protein